MRSRAPALVAVVAAAGLVGCGDDGGGGTASTSPPASTPAPAASPAPDALAGAGTDPVTVPATNADVALLTGVRAAPHPGYDRVVFEFRNTGPGYDVRYVPRPVRADASGDVVRVRGAAVLQVRIENALDADLDAPGAPRTYTGPTRIRPGTPQVAEVARVVGFEGVLTWVIGVRARAAFRVRTLEAPPRLVVDVRSG